MNTANYSVLDWFFIGQMIVIWMYVAGKAGAWLTGLILRLVVRRTPKGRVNDAVSVILAEHPIQNNQTLTLATKDQWTVVIYKRANK